MRKIVSIVCAAALAMPVAVVLPVATALPIAVAVPDSASAGHTYRRPGQRNRQNQYMSRPRKVDLRCVQQKMSQGSSYDQALRAC